MQVSVPISTLTSESEGIGDYRRMSLATIFICPGQMAQIWESSEHSPAVQGIETVGSCRGSRTSAGSEHSPAVQGIENPLAIDQFGSELDLVAKPGAIPKRSSQACD